MLPLPKLVTVRTLAIALAVSALVFAGCSKAEQKEMSSSTQSSAQPSQPLTTLRIGTLSNGIDYAPYLVAKEKRWFEEAMKGDSVVVEHLPIFDSLPTANEALEARKVDLLFEAEIPAIVGRASGKDLQIIGMQSAVVAEEIVVPSSSTARKLGDLKGKKIAVMAGSGYHYALLQALKRNGLTKRDVEIVPMVPPDAKAAFESGTIDAWSIWPHWPEEEVFNGKGKLVPGLGARVQGVTVVRGAFLREHPAVVSKALNVLERAKRWVKDNPAEAQRITSKTLGLRPEVVALAWPREVWDAALTPDVVSDIQNKADFLFNEGLIKKSVDVRRTLIAPTPVEALRKAA